MSKFKLAFIKPQKLMISPGRPRIRLDLDDQTLRVLYEKGESIASLSRKCHCSESTIRRHLELKA